MGVLSSHFDIAGQSLLEGITALWGSRSLVNSGFHIHNNNVCQWTTVQYNLMCIAANPQCLNLSRWWKAMPKFCQKGGSVNLLHFWHYSVAVDCHICASRNWYHNMGGLVEISKQKKWNKNVVWFCSLGLAVFHKWYRCIVTARNNNYGWGVLCGDFVIMWSRCRQCMLWRNRFTFPTFQRAVGECKLPPFMVVVSV